MFFSCTLKITKGFYGGGGGPGFYGGGGKLKKT